MSWRSMVVWSRGVTAASSPRLPVVRCADVGRLALSRHVPVRIRTPAVGRHERKESPHVVHCPVVAATHSSCPAADDVPLFFVLSAAAPAYAQIASLEPVVVTGSRTEQRLDDALAPITLITRADLERLQATDLAELISRQSGLQFTRTGGPGAQTSLFARGAGSSQVLVLVDGVRMNTATGGFAILSGINVDTIDRIEIVRGNLSSLYGSEAIGGVVQIFTRGSGAPRELVVGAEAGSGSTWGGSLSATQTFGQTRCRLPRRRAAASRSRRSMRRGRAEAVQLGANPDDDGNRQRSGTLRVNHSLGESTTLGLSAWTQRNRTDFDDTSDGPTATHDEDARSEAWQFSLRHAFGDVWTLRALAGEATDEGTNRSSNPFSFNNSEFDTRNRQGQVQIEAQLAERVTAQFGLEYMDQRGASTGYDPTFSNVLTRFSRHVTSGWFGVTGRTLGRWPAAGAAEHPA
jgi:vitamin B12 transporter